MDDPMVTANRERGIYQRVPGSGIWWIRYSDGSGRERREKAGTRSAARNLYSKRKTEILEGKKLPKNLRTRTTTFGKLLDAAKEHCERQTPRGAEKRYKCRVELLRSAFGSLPADSITSEMLSRWLADAAKENEWRPATANRYKAYISLAFRLGMENGKCKSNPARLVKRFKEDNERVRFLSEAEENRLRDVIRRDHPAHIPELDIALHTGVRRGEQYKLCWSDVDMQGRRITLRQTKNGTTRHVPLNSAALAAFEKLRKSSKGEGRVFIGEHGSPLERPRYWWDAAVATAKLTDFRWHDLRHTFASRCVMAGVDLRTLAELLGHKTLQMVMRYSHLSQAHKLAAVERLCPTPIGAAKTNDAVTMCDIPAA